MAVVEADEEDVAAEEDAVTTMATEKVIYLSPITAGPMVGVDTAAQIALLKLKVTNQRQLKPIEWEAVPVT